MPPERVEAFLESGDTVFQREVFHAVS